MDKLIHLPCPLSQLKGANLVFNAPPPKNPHVERYQFTSTDSAYDNAEKQRVEISQHAKEKREKIQHFRSQLSRRLRETSHVVPSTESRDIVPTKAILNKTLSDDSLDIYSFPYNRNLRETLIAKGNYIIYPDDTQSLPMKKKLPKTRIQVHKQYAELNRQQSQSFQLKRLLTMGGSEPPIRLEQFARH